MDYSKYLEMAKEEAPRMKEALDYIWKHPETGYREWKTEAYLVKEWEKLGYTLTRAGNIPGFIADLDTGKPGPKVLILAELDSLICHDHPDADPETGAVHACGHCAQAAALLGVAAVLARPGALEGLAGSVRLCMVPAEELIEIGYREQLRKQGVIKYFGGKCEFLYRGLFEGCDIAYMVHTAAGHHYISASKGSNGLLSKQCSFIGKAAHAGGAPWDGVNALYACNAALSACNALRETFRDTDYIRFHPIMTSGGAVVNAIPSTAGFETYVRGANYPAIRKVNERLNRAIAASAAAFGGNVVISDRPGYMPLYNDPTLGEVMAEAAKYVLPNGSEGINDGWDTGSTDMGDLSVVMPAIHMYCGGSAGIGHGNDYRIADFDSACVDSAAVQLVMLRMLLENDAAEAKRVIANSVPMFASVDEYLKAQDDLTLEVTAVEYRDDGTMSIRYR